MRYSHRYRAYPNWTNMTSECERLDRDWNAALNVVQRGLDKLGVGDAELTLVETGTAVDEDSLESVTASSVVEARSLGVDPERNSLLEA